MKVLILAPQVPWPPHQGTSIRNLHIVRHVAAEHDVTLVAFGDDEDIGPLEAAGIELVAVPPPPQRTLATRLRELFTTTTPDLARRLHSPALEAALDVVIRAAAPDGGFDVVQIEGLEMAQAGLTAAKHAWPHETRRRHRLIRPRAPGRLIYDAHNAEWVLQQRAWQADLRRARGWPGAGYSLLQTWKLRRFERMLLGRADVTVAVSRADAAALQAVAPAASITVVPNGVDLDFYPPADPDAVTPGLCVFVGKMDFRPNIDAMAWFVDHVWHDVRAARRRAGQAAELAVVGRDPSTRVRELAAVPGVTVTGAVDDVRPWLARASAVVVPLRVGGGTRLKVLEAMAMAKPIAATTMAVEGLDVTDGREALLADRPAALGAAVRRLLDEPDLRRELGQRARKRVAADYQWSALVPRIAALYHDATHGRPDR